jgi:hypothetical protein
MSRDRTQTRDRPGDTEGDATEFGVDDALESGSEAEPAVSQPDQGGGVRDRVGTRAKRLFSPRAFVAALLVTAGGLVAGNTLLPLPGAGLVGVFAATFLFGLAVSEPRYGETAVAGGLAVAASTFLDFAFVAFLGGVGVSLALLGGGVGALAGAAGNYFGRDLRDGLTRDI